MTVLHRHEFEDDPELKAHPAYPRHSRSETCPEAYNPTELGARRREGDWVHWWIVDRRGPITVGVLGQPTRPGRVACGNEENFVSLTSNRVVFVEWEQVGLACGACAELVHA